VPEVSKEGVPDHGGGNGYTKEKGGGDIQVEKICGARFTSLEKDPVQEHWAAPQRDRKKQRIESRKRKRYEGKTTTQGTGRGRAREVEPR